MKQLYFLALALICGLCAQAKVQTFTSIECNDPDHVAFSWRDSNADRYDIDLTAEAGDASWSHEADNYFYYFVTPAEGYKTVVEFFNHETGDAVKLFSGPFGKESLLAEAPNESFFYVFGSAAEIDAKITVSPIEYTGVLNVRIDGDPSRVCIKFKNGRRVAGLQVGDNVVNYSPNSETTAYLSCDSSPYDERIADGWFSEVTLDGKVLNYKADESTDDMAIDGNGQVSTSYYYNLTLKPTQEPAQQLYVNTVFEGDPVDVAITVNAIAGSDVSGFVQAVYVNGIEKADWAEPFKVNPGTNVTIVGDGRGYNVTRTTVNGTALSSGVSLFSQFVIDPLDVKFWAMKIDRPNIFTFLSSEGFIWTVSPKDGSQWSYKGGRNEIDFATAECPLQVVAFQYDMPIVIDPAVTEPAMYFYHNDAAVNPTNDVIYPITPKDGDEVRAIFAYGKPAKRAVSYMIEADATVPEIVYDYAVEADPALGHTSWDGTVIDFHLDNPVENNSFRIDVNGDALVPDADGNYRYVVAGKDAAVHISGRADISGLNSVVAAPVERDNSIYNLCGVRVDERNLTPGIYIQAGRKVVIR